MVQVCCLPR